MTVKDIMTLLESPDRVRVIKDGEEIYNQYFANMEVDKDIVAQIGDAEVKRFRAIPEITHRKYKERGLIAPMKPEETPDYSFRDLQLRKIIIVAAVVVIALGAGFTYTLYKVGEGMHLHRCGWRQPDDRGFM